MEGESRNLKKSLRMAILWVLLLLAALTGSTYAWFTFSGSASTNVTPAGGTIRQRGCSASDQEMPKQDLLIRPVI